MEECFKSFSGGAHHPSVSYECHWANDAAHSGCIGAVSQKSARVRCAN